MPRRTALIVPVPEAEPHVGDLRLRHDPMAALGVPAHVTVLFPFAAPEDVDEPEVAELAAAHAPFRFELAEVRRFGDDVTYLAPEPAAPFSALTEAAAARWPAYPPYEGVHEVVVPHLTVALGVVDLDLELPISCAARELDLLEESSDGRWSIRACYALGGVA
jgi:2'-5' RNA ligase